MFFARVTVLLIFALFFVSIESRSLRILQSDSDSDSPLDQCSNVNVVEFNKCIICQEEYTEDELKDAVQDTYDELAFQCGHKKSMHKNCVHDWMKAITKKETKCAICRTAMNVPEGLIQKAPIRQFMLLATVMPIGGGEMPEDMITDDNLATLAGRLYDEVPSMLQMLMQHFTVAVQPEEEDGEPDEYIFKRNSETGEFVRISADEPQVITLSGSGDDLLSMLQDVLGTIEESPSPSPTPAN